MDSSDCIFCVVFTVVLCVGGFMVHENEIAGWIYLVGVLCCIIYFIIAECNKTLKSDKHGGIYFCFVIIGDILFGTLLGFVIGLMWPVVVPSVIYLKLKNKKKIYNNNIV